MTLGKKTHSRHTPKTLRVIQVAEEIRVSFRLVKYGSEYHQRNWLKVFFKISRLEGDSKRIKMDTFSTPGGFDYPISLCCDFLLTIFKKKNVLEDPNWGLFALVVLAIVSLQAVPNLHYGIRCGLVKVLVFCMADVMGVALLIWAVDFLLTKFCWSTSASILEGFWSLMAFWY